MANQMQREQVVKMLRGLGCAGLILGPYIYTMARPEKSLKYRFIPSKNANGDLIKPDSSYNRLATEIAYRMHLPEQMRRQPKFDIRPSVHKGIEFDINGHFTPLFDGIAYLMIPQWANISSMNDLKNVNMNIYGHEIDFSRLDFSQFDQQKIKSLLHINDPPPVITEEPKQTPIESKSWFKQWFSSTPSTPVVLPTPPPTPPPPPVPLTRETLLIDKLIETFFLSDDAKKYIIADQFEIASGPWHIIPWFLVGVSFFLPFGFYPRFRLQFQTRLKRVLFFHFLLLNGLFCFYFSPFLARLVNMQISRIRDSSTISYGLDILEGGIEFHEKQLARNRILRELLPNGKDFFDQDGERRKTRLAIPFTNGLTISLYHWSPLISYRLKRLKIKMDKLMTASDDEARKTIFKTIPRLELPSNPTSIR